MSNKKVLVLVSGGIAAFKAVSFVRLLQANHCVVRVMMTESATKFVTPLTFATLTKNQVLTKMFIDEKQNPTGAIFHIEWGAWADVIVVIPATANIIAKIANGIADDLVSTTLLASNRPKYIVPAMNDNMWHNIATQQNLAQLKQAGIAVMEPATGLLAEGYQAKGRMPEPNEVYQWLRHAIQDSEPQKKQATQILKGQKILITAGGTREYLDPVRYIGNKSSGKMGCALAIQAQALGAEVTLIKTTTVTLPIPTGITVHTVETTSELAHKVKAEFAKHQIIIMAAAVADYQPKTRAVTKIKKKVNQSELMLTLIKTEDILAYLGHHKHQQFVVGFAAETNNLLAHAQAKLTAKKVNMIIANDVSNTAIGFDSNQNAVTLLQPNAANIQLAQADKASIAKQILTVIALKTAKQKN